jgi:pyruvate,water dikinase
VSLSQVDISSIAEVGGKGANLGELMRLGLPVPDGFVITTAAYRQHAKAIGLADMTATGADSNESKCAAVDAAAVRERLTGASVSDDLRQSILSAYREMNGARVAVRSSATAEDSEAASFAGQQETYLNVSTEESLLRAVLRCWASLWSERAVAYRQRQRIPESAVEMAVVVQRMADASLSGVAFTADPVTADRNTMIVDATLGLGESAVAGKVTPDTLRVSKRSREVLSYRVGNKTSMIVPADDGTRTDSVPPELQTRRIVGTSVLNSLVDLAVRIETHYGKPMDIEWAASGDHVTILQARPITALPAAPPDDWPLENPDAHYVRTSIAELLPDPLTPLFEELLRKAVNDAIEILARRYFGGPRFENYHYLTINGYAFYANYYPRRVWWPLVTGSWRFYFGFMKHAERIWRDVYGPRYADAVRQYSGRNPASMNADSIVSAVEEIIGRSTEYYTAVQALLWSVVPSELLFTWFYEKFVRRSDEPATLLFLLGEDSIPVRAEKSLYALAEWCKAKPTLAAYLKSIAVDVVARTATGGMTPAGVADADWRQWQSKLAAHLDQYGHLLYNLDFSVPTPADEPAAVLETFRFYLAGGGNDARERQQKAVHAAEAAIEQVASRLDWLRRRLFLKLVGWARHCVPLREDALSDVGLGWPLLRKFLLDLGRRLVDVGAVDRADDVFWLQRAEILDALRGDSSTSVGHLRERIETRRQLWQARRRARAPTILPKGARYLGLDVGHWVPGEDSDVADNSLRGIGASPGRVTGPARILRGPDDFSDMRPGEVLVASLTTPAWTPLFAMASAVVTDIGGPLSHSSIVAREYGIPAVLGTGKATHVLKSGMLVSVDGDRGRVTFTPFRSAT